ncbi:MAG TPA: hypothetical protein VII44_07065 [Puia sp.]
MATPIMIMGIGAGLTIVNQIKDLEVFFVNDHDKICNLINIHFNLYQHDKSFSE